MSDQTQTTPQTLTVTVDGRTIEARPGEWLIAAAERNGTYIPRFCYHPRMRPVGMCRMCLVEVDTGRGPALQTACTIPVADGMTVDTRSERVKKAQDGVLEFLLINHPLDCPVCDKGGECPLQDQTLAFGPGESRFVEEKRHWEKPIAVSDLVYLDRERCILCDRCTRFADEVAGDPLISFIGRGNETQVNTYPDDPFASYFSGNTVQICPVGALLAVPYRFRARPWDLEQVESTCTACSVGCRVAVQSSSNRLVRKLGVDVDPVNWSWLCDKGRFDFEWVNSEERLGKPLVRDGDELREASWSEALTRAAEGLAGARDRHGPGSVAVLGGARLPNEDAYAWSKLARTVLGTDSVDCQLADGLPADVVLGLPRATIDAACAADTILLLAPDLKEEVPVLYLRLRDAVVHRGAKVVELSPAATGMTPYAAHSLRHRPAEAAEVLRSLLGTGSGDGRSPEVEAAAEQLGSGSVVCVIGRTSVAESPDGVVAAAAALREARPDATFLPTLRRSNVQGALDMGLAPGVLPGRIGLADGRSWFEDAWGDLPAEAGLDATGILTAGAEGRLQGLVLLGADPLLDFPDRDLARRGVAGAGFVVAVDCFLTDSSRRADVVLPAAGYAERGGTTTNLEGRVSRLQPKITPPGTARPDWMIAAELALRLGGDLGVESTDDLWEEICRLAPSHQAITLGRLRSPEGFDGIVAGDVASDGVPVAPPSMAQTDAPAIHAADDQGGPSGVNQSGMGSGEKTDPTLGAAPAGEPAESAAAESASGDDTGYASGPAGDDEEAAEASVDASEAGGVEALDPSGGGAGSRTTPSRPPLLQWAPPESRASLPAVDSYSLRLIASRTLYDEGTLTQRSPSLAPLAVARPLLVNPADLDRLGVTSGSQVRVTSSRTTLRLEAKADTRVPKGSAVLAVNQPGPDAADLIDVTQPVTDLRVETLAQGGEA